MRNCNPASSIVSAGKDHGAAAETMIAAMATAVVDFAEAAAARIAGTHAACEINRL